MTIKELKGEVNKMKALRWNKMPNKMMICYTHIPMEAVWIKDKYVVDDIY